MREPSVCCVMSTANRQEMATRAVECFRSQTYENKALLIVDTGTESFQFEPRDGELRLFWHARTIGEIRNFANHSAGMVWPHDIICTLDDDDISHPDRIAEQVALLQSSGADAVGYNEMLFWDSRAHSGWTPVEEVTGIISGQGEAWLYSNSNPRYVLGSSLAYYRKAWEKRPFEALNDGEDTAWRMGVNCIGVSSLVSSLAPQAEPRMVCSIHAGNTSPWYRPELLRASEKQGGEWKRAEAWDDFCRERMTLGVKV